MGEYNNKNDFVLKIINDGIPISDEDIQKIVNGKTKGLGMKIILKIVKAHNWKLNIENKEGTTVFNLNIPLSDLEIL